jgi:hypothetical protein
VNCSAEKDNKHKCGICGSSRETRQAADEQKGWGHEAKT